MPARNCSSRASHSRLRRSPRRAAVLPLHHQTRRAALSDPTIAPSQEAEAAHTVMARGIVASIFAAAKRFGEDVDLAGVAVRLLRGGQPCPLSRAPVLRRRTPRCLIQPLLTTLDRPSPLAPRPSPLAPRLSPLAPRHSLSATPRHTCIGPLIALASTRAAPTGSVAVRSADCTDRKRCRTQR